MPGGAIEEGRWLRCGSETGGKRRQSTKRGKEEGKKQSASDEDQEQNPEGKRRDYLLGATAAMGGSPRYLEVRRA